MYLSEDRIMEFKLIAGFINYKVHEKGTLLGVGGGGERSTDHVVLRSHS